MSEQFSVGQRVEIAAPIDLKPYGVLAVGEIGRVQRVEGRDGVFVKWHKRHKTLDHWDNTTLLVQPELAHLRPYKANWPYKLSWVAVGAALTYMVLNTQAVASLIYNFLT